MLVGSCRGDDDKALLDTLKNKAQALGITERVEFCVNVPFPELKCSFSRASVGIHTMWNEHFGIGVVEMMAAGLITIGHDSGGPKEDIIVPMGGEITGYRASDVASYA